MNFGGFSIGDWESLVGLIAILLGSFLTMFKYMVMKPLNDSIKDLGIEISRLGKKAEKDARENAHDIDSLGNQVNGHGERLTKLETWKEAHEKYVKEN